MSSGIDESISEKVPALLDDILKKTFLDASSTELKQTDVFVILVVFLLSENGFLHLAHNTMDVQPLHVIDNKRLVQWRQPTGLYEVRLVMTEFCDTAIKFMFSPLEASILINVIISEISSEVYTVCLPVSRYIVSLDVESVPLMFRDIQHLSNVIKNNIVTPVKSAIFNYYGYSSASFTGLPEEILFQIMLYLPVSDIITIAQSCKKLSLQLNNENLWHKLLLRDFTNIISITEDQNWKSLYRSIYIMQQDSKNRARCSRGTLHDLMDISDSVSYIDNPMWDVII